MDRAARAGGGPLYAPFPAAASNQGTRSAQRRAVRRES
jgi:hypothetical protein